MCLTSFRSRQFERSHDSRRKAVRRQLDAYPRALGFRWRPHASLPIGERRPVHSGYGRWMVSSNHTRRNRPRHRGLRVGLDVRAQRSGPADGLRRAVAVVQLGVPARNRLRAARQRLRRHVRRRAAIQPDGRGLRRVATGVAERDGKPVHLAHTHILGLPVYTARHAQAPRG